MESPIITVHVQEPNGKDQAMLAALKLSGLVEYLAMDAPERFEITPAQLQRLAELREKFPGSHYAELAAIATGTYYVQGVNGHPDLPAAKHIFNDLESNASTAATAAYYLGLIALKEGDVGSAQRYMQSAQDVSPNPLIQQRTHYRLIEIARRQKGSLRRPRSQ